MSSVSLWLNNVGLTHHRDTEDTEVAQRRARSPNPFRTFRFPPRAAHESGRVEAILDLVSKHIGAGWIHLSTYNIMNVYGLEHVEAAAHESTPPARRESSLVLRHVCRVDSAVSQHELAQATLFSRAWEILLPVTARALCELDHGLVVHVSAILRHWGSSDSGEARV